VGLGNSQMEHVRKWWDQTMLSW